MGYFSYYALFWPELEKSEILPYFGPPYFGLRLYTVRPELIHPDLVFQSSRKWNSKDQIGQKFFCNSRTRWILFWYSIFKPIASPWVCIPELWKSNSGWNKLWPHCTVVYCSIFIANYRTIYNEKGSSIIYAKDSICAFDQIFQNGLIFIW